MHKWPNSIFTKYLSITVMDTSMHHYKVSKLQNCTQHSNCDFHEKADPFLHFFVFLASFKLDSVSTRTNKKDDTSVKTHLHSNRTNVQKVSISSKTYYRSVFNLSKTQKSFRKWLSSFSFLGLYHEKKKIAEVRVSHYKSRKV